MKNILKSLKRGLILVSRSWTPQEQCHVDLFMTKRDNVSYKDKMFSIVFTGANGESHPMISDKEKEILVLFKELGFLFSSNLYHLWLSAEEHPRCRKRVLNEVEIELEKIIDADINKKGFNGLDSTVVKWYLGELDPHFYYNDMNNQYFEEYLYDKIMKK